MIDKLIITIFKIINIKIHLNRLTKEKGWIVFSPLQDTGQIIIFFIKNRDDIFASSSASHCGEGEIRTLEPDYLRLLT